jgi:hypothetical protein
VAMLSGDAFLKWSFSSRAGGELPRTPIPGRTVNKV